MDIVEILRTTDLFEGLGDEQLRAVAPLCEERAFAQGERVIEAGEKGTEIYVLPRGRVTVDIPLGESIFVNRAFEVTAGEVFGELALYDHERTARVTAREDISVLSIAVKRLHALMREQPSLGLTILYNMGAVLARKLLYANLTLRRNLEHQIKASMPSEVMQKEERARTSNDDLLSRMSTLQLEAGDPKAAAATALEIVEPRARAEHLMSVAGRYLENGDKETAQALIAVANDALGMV